MSDLPYPPDTGRTHYEGCWKERGHHNCAVERVRQLEGDRLILDWLNLPSRLREIADRAGPGERLDVRQIVRDIWREDAAADDSA